MPCLVRRLDNTVAFLTNDNIRMMSRTSTPRPAPAISKSLVRQPSLNYLTASCKVAKIPNHTGPPPGLPPVKGSQRNGPPPGLPPDKTPNHAGPPPGLPPIKSSHRFVLKVGEKRNISSQELKIIIDSIKEIRNKIRYDNLTCENKLDYQIILMKLSKKLC